MNKIILLFSALMIFIFFTGCKAPACSTLSWGETSKIEEKTVELKYNAGSNCENYSDYYDEDIEGVINKIQNMKFVSMDNCRIYNPDIVDGEEWEDVNCPEFVLKTVEFTELKGCEFNTPPDENTDCETGPLTLFFSGVTTDYSSTWFFENSGNLSFFDENVKNELDMSLRMAIVSGETMAKGYFANKNLNAFTATVKWKETNEGVEVEKVMTLSYTVETKE